MNEVNTEAALGQWSSALTALPNDIRFYRAPAPLTGSWVPASQLPDSAVRKAGDLTTWISAGTLKP